MLSFSGTDDALFKGCIDNSRALWEGHLHSLPVAMIGSTISTHADPGAIAVAFFSAGQKPKGRHVNRKKNTEIGLISAS